VKERLNMKTIIVSWKNFKKE